MDKNKIELIILIVLITFGINYGVYSMYISPELARLSQAAAEYENTSARLADLKNKSRQVEDLKKETEKLKETAQKLDELAPLDINTPQLIYDLYTSCRKFGITGEDVNLQISDGTNPPGAGSSAGSVSNSVSSTGSAGSTAKTETTGNGQTSEELKLMNLSVTLKVYGDKNKIEEYLKNLNKLSGRKLNVKSITLSVRNSSSAPVSGAVPSRAQALNAVIVLTQYVQVNSSMQETVRSYDFYNSKVGFQNISDVFGSYGQSVK